MSARRMITVIVPGYIVDYCCSTFHFISIIVRLTYSQYVCAMYDLVTVGLPGYTYTVHYYRLTRFFYFNHLKLILSSVCRLYELWYY